MPANDDLDQNKTNPNPTPFGTNPAMGFGRLTLWIGILLLILGAVGIALPPLLAITTSDLVSLLFIVGGGVWAWHTWQQGGGFMSWMKPFLLLVSGVLMVANPLAGVAALALLLSFYLLMDAFGSFALASALRPGRGWIWMAVNGVMDLLLALSFTISWPTSSMLLVGIFVGISLLFDGAALVAIGWAQRKAS